MSNGEKPSDDAVFVALTAQHAIVRVMGRGSFKVSTSFKQFAESVLKKKLPLILVDMTDCIGMDSTFMGVTAGIAARLKSYGGSVVMVNCSQRTRSLLSTLGLDQIITAFEAADTPAPYRGLLPGQSSGEQLATAGADKTETIQTMLEAHQTIVDVVPETRPQFQDVLTYLHEELVRKTQHPQGA